MIILILPAFQMCTRLFKVKELKGWYEVYNKPEFTLSGWLSGKYQTRFDRYFETSFGFRPWFVRIYNQISFSFNGKPKVSNVKIGRDRYLFEKYYLKTYTGQDFLGYNSLSVMVDSLKQVRDSLSKYGTELVICLASGKASFYPEYFPDEFYGIRTDSTNYLILRDIFRKSDLHFIDFNAWFLRMKDHSIYPLYPKYGIHWSQYGAWLAADSMLRYVEKITDKDLADMILENIEISNKPRGVDYDIGEALNLIFRLPGDTLAYPKFHWETKNKDTLTTIVIADSYYWPLFSMGISKIALNPGSFWFYNRMVYPGKKPIEEIDYLESLKSADIIILMSTESNLCRFPFGFLKDSYRAFNITKDL